MPDRIATARQSGEGSSLREKVARAIQDKIPGWLAEDGSVDDEDLADAAIAVCMEEAASGWQPIETAPKDQTVILAIGSNDRYPQPMLWEAYSEEDAEEIGEDGYWTYAENLIADVAGTAEPTHWQHLPEPPLRTLDKRLEKPGKGVGSGESGGV